MSSTRVAALRALLSQHSLNALIVPSEDAHQSEYVAAQDKRREFISGFSGSAGIVIITPVHALLWTDGRYWDQAKQQLDAGWTLMQTGTAGVPSIGEWLRSNVTESVGFDAALTSVSSFRRLCGELQNGPCTLTATHSNLVDLVWASPEFEHLRPQIVSSPLSVHPISRAGRSVDSKINDVRSQLVSNSCDAMIVSALDSIAWLFNLRGFDIPFNPVFFAHALITSTSAVLYIDSDKITAEVREHLQLASATIRPYSEFINDVQSMNDRYSKVWIDPDTCNVAVHSVLKAGSVFERTSPLVLVKAIKNDIELAGVRAAHERDAAAMCEFMCWLETIASDSNTDLNECSVAAKLLEFRAAQPHFVQPSFETISGFGPNGAVCLILLI
jgi:Xaa-Pro aminopeptidase